jgi:hypothetical protein
MARQLSSRERRLLIVLGLAVVATAWFMLGGDDPSRVGGEDDAEAGAGAMGSAPRVMMTLLTRDAEPYDPNGRDLFKYGQRPPSPEDIEARKRREEAQRDRQRQLQEQAARAQEAKRVVPKREVGPRPPRATFRYLGYLGPKDERIAVFEQKEELILARVGELVEEDFRVMEIQYESVVLGFTDPRFESRTETLEMAGK